MRNENQLINHYINSRDTNFLSKNNILPDYFISTGNIIEWVDDYIKSNKSLPTIETVDSKFEDFEIITELDAIPYLVDELKKNRVYTEYRPLLMESAELMSQGQVLEAINRMRVDIESLTRAYKGKIERYDWVKDSELRYEKYLETHNKEGLSGVSTGINKLDDLTGGWKKE